MNLTDLYLAELDREAPASRRALDGPTPDEQLWR